MDSFLLFFTALTAYAFALFKNQKAFSRKWRASLFLTGISIGCVSSVKWVGFLVTALVGLHTIEELWEMLGDLKMKKNDFARHFLSRVACLIVIPVFVYAFCFQIHFHILNRSGTGDANMSSLFQAGLSGSKIQESPKDIAYGSIITMKSNYYGGGLLHSHAQVYPKGSKQRQVTTYHHKDYNNDWLIMKSYSEKQTNTTEDGDAWIIKDGDVIRLKHIHTSSFLHSHRVTAPITHSDYEVSGYGGIGIDDPNDLWTVEIVSDSLYSDKKMHTLSTKFRLKHIQTGCYLKSQNKPLPEWGFKQGEVTCDHSGNKNSRGLMWNVETNVNPLLPKGDSKTYKSGFWDNFRDCNVGMWLVNNALTPDPELEPSILTSQAKDWFFMLRGIRMSSWDDNKTKFYMLGNPTVWITSSVTILIVLVYLCINYILNHRQIYIIKLGKKFFLKSHYFICRTS